MIEIPNLIQLYFNCFLRMRNNIFFLTIRYIISMFEYILFVIFIIIFFFFLSDEPKINEFISKKYMNYFLLLCILYLIYQQYHIGVLLSIFLLFIYMNVDLKEKITKNEYLLSYTKIKKIIQEVFENINTNTYANTHANTHANTYANTKESFTNNTVHTDVTNTENTKELNTLKKEKIEDNIEPFKTEVLKLKDLYENIKMEIKKL